VAQLTKREKESISTGKMFYNMVYMSICYKTVKRSTQTDKQIDYVGYLA